MMFGGKMSEVDLLIGKVGEALTASDVADLNVMWTRGRGFKSAASRRRWLSVWISGSKFAGPTRTLGASFTVAACWSVGDDAASRLDRRRAERECLQGRGQDGFGLDASRHRSERVAVQSGGISLSGAA
jgi:hypothetical protein